MKNCKITVMRITTYPELSAEFENPIEHACDMQVGMTFITHGDKKPDGLCESAWSVLYPFVSDLANGGGNFFDSWMKNAYSAMVSCNDGFRPVSFLVEAIDD